MTISTGAIIIVCLTLICVALAIKLILLDNQVDQLRGYIASLERQSKRRSRTLVRNSGYSEREPGQTPVAELKIKEWVKHE